ncbi:unnamed protein product [Ectocarpus fasciculatus]
MCVRGLGRYVVRGMRVRRLGRYAVRAKLVYEEWVRAPGERVPCFVLFCFGVGAASEATQMKRLRRSFCRLVNMVGCRHTQMLQSKLQAVCTTAATTGSRSVMCQCGHSYYLVRSCCISMRPLTIPLVRCSRFLYQTRCSCVLLLAHRVLVCLYVCLLSSSEDLPQSFPCRMRVCG